jgi:hypothetical protein
VHEKEERRGLEAFMECTCDEEEEVEGKGNQISP